jgi:DNA-formamidopyrimidine glycosylase
VPEGPEVKRFAVSLAERLSDQTLLSIEVLSGRYTKKDMPGLSEIGSSLPIEIVGAGCHGKFLFIILRNEWSIWSSLGMTGSWAKRYTRHSRVKLVLKEGSPVYFNDMRNFGTIKCVSSRHSLIRKIKSLGPDMLGEDVSDEIFFSQIKKHPKKTIAQALMDQKVIAGVGNYLKSECLYFARFSPHRLCEDFTEDELSILNRTIKKIIRLSYDANGATLRNYKNFDGETGKYSQRFAVYNQTKDPKGREIRREKTKDKRTTFWVPEVQK